MDGHYELTLTCALSPRAHPSPCSWFVSHRRQKAADLSDAHAMALRRLQRQGALQWLKVGLARRQQRLSQLAMHQVREAAGKVTYSLFLTRMSLRHTRCLDLVPKAPIFERMSFAQVKPYSMY